MCIINKLELSEVANKTLTEIAEYLDYPTLAYYRQSIALSPNDLDMYQIIASLEQTKELISQDRFDEIPQAEPVNLANIWEAIYNAVPLQVSKLIKNHNEYQLGD